LEPCETSSNGGGNRELEQLVYSASAAVPIVLVNCAVLRHRQQKASATAARSCGGGNRELEQLVYSASAAAPIVLVVNCAAWGQGQQKASATATRSSGHRLSSKCWKKQASHQQYLLESTLQHV